MINQSKNEFLDKAQKIIEDCCGYLPQTNCWGLSLFYYGLNNECLWFEPEEAEEKFLSNFVKKDISDLESGDLVLVRNKLKENILIHSFIFIDENSCFHKWGKKRPHVSSLQSIIVYCRNAPGHDIELEVYKKI